MARALVTFLRSQWRLARHSEPSVNIDQLLKSEAVGQRIGRLFVSGEEDPESAAEVHELDWLLAEGLAALSNKDRRVVELEGSCESQAEVAAEAGRQRKDTQAVMA